MAASLNDLDDFYWWLGNYIHYHLNLTEDTNSNLFKYILGQHYGEYILRQYF